MSTTNSGVGSTTTLLLFLLGLTTAWDTFTTITGTYTVLGETAGSFILSLIFATLISATLISTAVIWKMDLGDDVLAIILRIAWFASIGYDVYTSYIGNRDYVLDGNAEHARMVLLVGITGLVSGAPIVLSLLWSRTEGGTKAWKPK